MLKKLINLQRFSEETPTEPVDPVEPKETPTEPVEPTEPPKVEQTPPNDPPVEPVDPKQEQADNNLPKTQEELDKIINDRLARERKKQEGAKSTDERVETLETELTQLKFERSALAQSVTENNLAKVIKLAKLEDTDDPTQAVVNVLAEFPIFVDNGNVISTGNKNTNNPQEDTETERLANIRKRMGLD